MKIRHATLEDGAAMAEIYAPYVRKTSYSFEYEPPQAAEMAGRVAQKQVWCPWLVAEEDGAILGYAYAEKPFVRAAYSWAVEFSVYLSEDARGRGVGRLLYAVLERMALAQGYYLAYALIADENGPSCRFHESLGFRKGTVMRDCGFKLGAWHSLYWYEKWLRPQGVPEAVPTPAPEMDWTRLELRDLIRPGLEICL